MAKAKKVKAEVVEGKESRSSKAQSSTFKQKVLVALFKMKLVVAIVLDAIDLVLANIPIINTIWDFITFAVLMVILKNKWLAVGAFVELPLIGIPLLGQIDALIPIATILVLADTAETVRTRNS